MYGKYTYMLLVSVRLRNCGVPGAPLDFQGGCVGFSRFCGFVHLDGKGMKRKLTAEEPDPQGVLIWKLLVLWADFLASHCFVF